MALTHRIVPILSKLSDSLDFELVTVTEGDIESTVDLSAFEHDSGLSVILHMCRPELATANWLEGIPAWVVAHLPIDALIKSVTLRRGCLSADRVGGFSQVDGALREWLTRAVAAGETMRVETTDATVDDFDLPVLRPESPPRSRQWILDAVAKLDFETANSEDDTTAVKAGLLMFNDFLDESHEYSQSVQGAGRNAAGDYWHGIMHRREPDYSNAKYWYRRVGSHPIFGDLANEVSRLLETSKGIDDTWQSRLIAGGDWDPFAFVDLCEACPADEEDDQSLFAQRVQWMEMVLLLKQTIVDAGL